MIKKNEKYELLKKIAEKNELKIFSNSLESEISETKVSIALLGEFSSGKSTLANVFLGKKILPSLEKPSSSAIVEIIGSEKLKAIFKKGNEFQEIELSELDEYIMGDKSKEIDKVIIESVENEFIQKGIKIIDTPGINSINEVHDEITFGYLPFIDSALIILNANQGGVTNSLIKFLKEKIIFENQLSKIIFVINFADNKSEEELNSILENAKNQLHEIIKDPNIVAISALEALNGNIEESNINSLKKLLLDNVIKVKDVLLEKRYDKIFNEKCSQLSKLLSEELNALKIDNSELEKNLEKIKKEIICLDDENTKIKHLFEDLKSNINNYLISIAENYTNFLLDSAMNNKIDEFDAYVIKLSNDVTNYINKQFKSFNSSMTIKIDNLSYELKNNIEENILYIRDTIDGISPIITGVIVASLTGPAGILGSEVAGSSLFVAIGKKFGLVSSSSKDTFLKETLSKVLPVVSDFIEMVDIPNKLLKIGANSFIKKEIQEQIENVLISSINITIKDLEKEVELIINEKVINPQKQLEKALNDIRTLRKSNIESVFKKKEELEEDINNLRFDL